MTCDAFWFLVRSHLRAPRTGRLGRAPSAVQVVVRLIAIIAALACVTVGALTRTFDVRYVMLGAVALPYIMLALGFGSIASEARHDTDGWWLALPYARTHLVCAKWIALLIRSLRICAVAFVAVSLLGIYAQALMGDLSREALRPILTLGLPWFAMVAAAAPAVAGLGVVLGVLGRSVAKVLTPLVWVLCAVCVNIPMWASLRAETPDSSAFVMYGPPLSVAAVVLPAALLAGAALVVAAGSVLEADPGL